MAFTCTVCDREFDANKVLKIHLSRCALKITQIIENKKHIIKISWMKISTVGPRANKHQAHSYAGGNPCCERR